jgi:hypothetical protein
MLLFAVELHDGTAYLLAAPNATDAIEEAERRSGVRPAYFWVLAGARRTKVF